MSLADWLLQQPQVTAAESVRVIFADLKFDGVFYTHCEPYAATERAVTEGRAHAGEPRVSYRFYLLGRKPKFLQKRALQWQHGKPLDGRVVRPGGEWYVACHSDKQPGEFGHFFMLCEYTPMVWGYYKDWKIDTGERKPYARTPMQVVFAAQQ